MAGSVKRAARKVAYGTLFGVWTLAVCAGAVVMVAFSYLEERG